MQRCDFEAIPFGEKFIHRCQVCGRQIISTKQKVKALCGKSIGPRLPPPIKKAKPCNCHKKPPEENGGSAA